MPNPLAQPNLEQLIVLTEQLTEQLGRDAAAFEARRAHEVAATIAETTRLANLYRLQSARVQQDPAVIAGAPRELRARLVRASEAFERTLKRHGRALYAVKTVTEGIVHAIAEEVVRARGAGAAYGSSALACAPDATAITLNRRA